MADSKITALTALTTADPATDMFPVVDVSDTTMAASGTTKRISINNILACSPTATLASATITGNLTVDTSTLKVDSANNRVGIGTASPADSLHVYGSGNALIEGTAGLYGRTNYKIGAKTWQVGYRSGTGQFEIQEDLVERYTIGNGGTPHTWYIGASTAMTLNSTGLGVGVTPTVAKVQTNGAFATNGALVNLVGNPLANALIADFSTTCRLIATGANTGTAGVHKFIVASSNASVYLEAMEIDALGNVITRSPGAPPTLTANGQLTANATSNTNLRFSYRGSDGVTRVGNLALS